VLICFYEIAPDVGRSINLHIALVKDIVVNSHSCCKPFEGSQIHITTPAPSNRNSAVFNSNNKTNAPCIVCTTVGFHEQNQNRIPTMGQNIALFKIHQAAWSNFARTRVHQVARQKLADHQCNTRRANKSQSAALQQISGTTGVHATRQVEQSTISAATHGHKKRRKHGHYIRQKLQSNFKL